VIVRPDLPKGLLAAQVVHAAGESTVKPVPSGTYAIVLAHEGLEELSRELCAQGVVHKPIVENSGPYAGMMTAIGVMPQLRSKLRRYFSSYPLLR